MRYINKLVTSIQSASESISLQANGALMNLRAGTLCEVIRYPIGDVKKDGYRIEFPGDACDVVTSSSCDCNRIVRLKVKYIAIK